MWTESGKLNNIKRNGKPRTMTQTNMLLFVCNKKDQAVRICYDLSTSELIRLWFRFVHDERGRCYLLLETLVPGTGLAPETSNPGPYLAPGALHPASYPSQEPRNPGLYRVPRTVNLGPYLAPDTSNLAPGYLDHCPYLYTSDAARFSSMTLDSRYSTADTLPSNYRR